MIQNIIIQQILSGLSLKSTWKNKLVSRTVLSTGQQCFLKQDNAKEDYITFNKIFLSCFKIRYFWDNDPVQRDFCI